jgi:thiamine pyrophosphokinase
LRFERPVLLAGPADLDISLFRKLKKRGFSVIAADGGANTLLANDIVPEAIIGDLDSLVIPGDRTAVISEGGASELREISGSKVRIIRLSEQDSTDFEKCLYSLDAPLYLAFGFTGKRFDHTLATLNVMTKYHRKKKILLFSGEDINVVHSGNFVVSPGRGQIFSIFPLMPISFSHSEGLKYPLDGLKFEIGSNIGTSNSTCADKVEIFPTPEHQKTPYLVTLPNHMLEQLLKSFM